MTCHCHDQELALRRSWTCWIITARTNRWIKSLIFLWYHSVPAGCPKVTLHGAELMVGDSHVGEKERGEWVLSFSVCVGCCWRNLFLCSSTHSTEAGTLWLKERMGGDRTEENQGATRESKKCRAGVFMQGQRKSHMYQDQQIVFSTWRYIVKISVGICYFNEKAVAQNYNGHDKPVKHLITRYQ